MMTHTFNRLRPAYALMLCMACAYVTISPQLHASEIQVGRYSELRAMPTVAQANLLSTTITVWFPQRIQTLGDAVHYLLQRSGYRLADSRIANSITANLLGLPLPAVHRNLGPITLKQALETLVGPVFRLVQDPVHRLVSFELGTSVRGTTYEPDSSSKKEDPQNGE